MKELKEEIKKLSAKNHWFFTKKDVNILLVFISKREKELLGEAIKIFEKNKYETMTGNVVLLELKVMLKELSNE